MKTTACRKYPQSERDYRRRYRWRRISTRHPARWGKAHGYRVVNHVPPTPAFFSYTVSWTFGIFWGNLHANSQGQGSSKRTSVFGDEPDCGEYTGNTGAYDDDLDGFVLVDREVSEDEVARCHSGQELCELFVNEERMDGYADRYIPLIDL